MKYIHIFDYFDENGRYIGGYEAESNSIEKPDRKGQKGFRISPSYVIYVGWCVPDEKVSSGCHFPDAATYDRETKKLTPIYEEGKETIFGKIQRYSKSSPAEMTIEKCCEFKGMPLPERYAKHKEAKEKEFREEWQCCVDDPEYFRKNYYKRVHR